MSTAMEPNTGPRAAPATREAMLSRLLGEVRRERRRRRARRVGTGALLAMLLVVGALGVWRLAPSAVTSSSRSGLASGGAAPSVSERAAERAETGDDASAAPADRVARSSPDPRRPLVIVVGTRPGLVERARVGEPRVRAVVVSDEQLLAALNERGPRYGLVRVEGAAALVPLRSP